MSLPIKTRPSKQYNVRVNRSDWQAGPDLSSTNRMINKKNVKSILYIYLCILKIDYYFKAHNVYFELASYI